MFKIATIIFAFLYSVFCVSQSKDLYIFYNDNSELVLSKSLGDSIQIKEYIFNLTIPSTYLTLSIKDGKIIRQINLPSENARKISFTYVNLDSDNDIFLINDKKIKMKLKYHDMKGIKELNNLNEFLSLFENLYLIKEEDFFDGFYIARKVSYRIY